MKIIEKLSKQMECEMHDAENYIECAMFYKEQGELLLSKMYYDLSVDEVKHADLLHDSSVRLINEYKNTGEEVPLNMKAVYDYLHEKHIERMNKIKLHQAMYRG